MLWTKLQHAGVVFLRDFVALTAGLHYAVSSAFGKDVGAAAIASAFAALADLIAHKPAA